jgi:hypothetical protein
MNRKAAVQKNSAKPADSRLHSPPGALNSPSSPFRPFFSGAEWLGAALNTTTVGVNRDDMRYSNCCLCQYVAWMAFSILPAGAAAVQCCRLLLVAVNAGSKL